MRANRESKRTRGKTNVAPCMTESGVREEIQISAGMGWKVNKKKKIL